MTAGLFYYFRPLGPKEGGGRAKKHKPRHPGPRGSGELGEDHHNQQFYLAGYDGEVYAPTAHTATVRMIIALSIQKNETLYKLDIKDAFPQCEEKSELYTTPIEGFALPKKPGHIALLQAGI